MCRLKAKPETYLAKIFLIYEKYFGLYFYNKQTDNSKKNVRISQAIVFTEIW